MTLTGNQKKIDKNKDGKISGEDFKILRSQKMAKGGSIKSKDKNSKESNIQLSGTNFSGIF
jgi:hypothetical protein|tara:strand:+ start:425 stop:607 length:183 start_codon:yes stop_codon:yes gene_type:complete